MPFRRETIFRFLVVAYAANSIVLLAAFRFDIGNHLLLISLSFLLPPLIITFLYRHKGLQAEARHLENLVQVRREMDRHERRYRNLLEYAGDAIFVLDAETGKLQEMNRKAAEMFGYNVEEMAELSGKDLVPGRAQEGLFSLIRRLRKGKEYVSTRLPFTSRDGNEFIGEVTARIIDLGDDERVIQAIIRDMTFKDRADRQIRRKNRELFILNNLIERANRSLQLDSVLDTVLRETVEALGAAAGAIHLIDSAKSALVLSAHRGFMPETVSAVARLPLQTTERCGVLAWGNCHASSRHCQEPCTIINSSPPTWQSFVGIPLRAQGEVTGVMHLISTDPQQYSRGELSFFATMGSQIGNILEHASLFGELNARNDELLRSYHLLEKSSRRLTHSEHRLRETLSVMERSNLELERIDRMKNHFLGMISHEFKTPLTTIISGAQVLQSLLPESAVEERRVAEIIEEGGDRLHEIVSNLLKMAKLEAHRTVLDCEPLRLAEVLEDVTRRLEPLLTERRQTITVADVTGIPIFSADRSYIEEIVAELLENAVKFTPDGGTIEIAARVVMADDLADREAVLERFNRDFVQRMHEKAYLELAIRDSGIGIDEGEQVKIFEKFYEIGDINHHSSGSHRFQGKGAGLGLAIVKGMVEAHGGMVWVEGFPEGGSVFLILLPLQDDEGQTSLPFDDVT